MRAEIDWDRRYRHMQRHSAQHLLSQAFLHVGGAFETRSVALGSPDATLDLAGDPEYAVALLVHMAALAPQELLGLGEHPITAHGLPAAHSQHELVELAADGRQLDVLALQCRELPREVGPLAAQQREEVLFQRMMHGIVLDGSSPLFGRARELFRVEPLEPEWIPTSFGARDPRRVVEIRAAWEGVPRYWELAVDLADVRGALDRLVLDPAGPLHREPDRLLVEELPPAPELRPVLEAIGMGARRLSEIAERIGAAATSISRPLRRLQDMGLVVREVPFGEAEMRTRSSLYRIGDPFVRLWFRLVPPPTGDAWSPSLRRSASTSLRGSGPPM